MEELGSRVAFKSFNPDFLNFSNRFVSTLGAVETDLNVCSVKGCHFMRIFISRSKVGQLSSEEKEEGKIKAGKCLALPIYSLNITKPISSR